LIPAPAIPDRQRDANADTDWTEIVIACERAVMHDAMTDLTAVNALLIADGPWEREGLENAGMRYKKKLKRNEGVRDNVL